MRIHAGRPVDQDLTLTYELGGLERQIHLWFVDGDDKITDSGVDAELELDEIPGLSTPAISRTFRRIVKRGALILTILAAVMMVLLVLEIPETPGDLETYLHGERRPDVAPDDVSITHTIVPVNRTRDDDNMTIPRVISVVADHDRADTWSSVLVTVRAPPYIVNNTTYYVDRNVTLNIFDLDEQETLITVELGLYSGIATYNFRILPEWGEFLLEVRVFDNLTAAQGSDQVRVEYSMDWILYIMEVQDEETIEELREENAVSNTRHEWTGVLNFVIVFMLVPIALLRLDHKAARRQGRSSLVDKIVERWFNYTLVPASMWHYLEDPRYEFPSGGRVRYGRTRLEFGLDVLRSDQAALSKVEVALEKEIKRLYGGEQNVTDDDSSGTGRAVPETTESPSETPKQAS